MTISPCPTAAQLAALAAATPEPGVALHADTCERCARRVEAARRLFQANITRTAVAEHEREVDTLVAQLLSLPPGERPSAATSDE